VLVFRFFSVSSNQPFPLTTSQPQPPLQPSFLLSSSEKEKEGGDDERVVVVVGDGERENKVKKEEKN
jgi:hypothetical protein